MKRIVTLLFFFFALAACEKEPEITDAILDGEVLMDPSLYQPEKYLHRLFYFAGIIGWPRPELRNL